MKDNYNLLKKEEIGFMFIMKNKQALFAFIWSAVSMYCVSFFGGFLSLEMAKYGVKDD